MGRPRVKVVNPNEGWMGTEYYIDGKKKCSYVFQNHNSIPR